MANILNKNSSLSDITNYIRNYKQPPFSATDIIPLLDNLCNLEIDSYSFSFGANTASRTISKDIITHLEKYLESYRRGYKNYVFNYAFSAYYLLSYYYREYEKMVQLEKLIAQYEDIFLQYALTYQIRGRLLRRNGNGKEALKCDLKAMSILDNKNIQNLGVSITYASTVSIALENREEYINKDDIDKSFKAVEDAMQLNPKYAKYSYLMAKLMMFALQFDTKDYEYAYCKQCISESKELLRKSIELEDEKSDAYMSHVIEYKSYMRQADLILAEIRMSIQMKQQSNEAADSIAADFKNAQKEVDNKLHQTQNRFLEILALFVSVVAIIMVVIGMFSNQFTITQTIATIIVMNVCVIAVYSAFLILLHKKIMARYVISILLCVLIILAVVFAINYSDIIVLVQHIF